MQERAKLGKAGQSWVKLGKAGVRPMLRHRGRGSASTRRDVVFRRWIHHAWPPRPYTVLYFRPAVQVPPHLDPLGRLCCWKVEIWNSRLLQVPSGQLAKAPVSCLSLHAQHGRANGKDPPALSLWARIWILGHQRFLKLLPLGGPTFIPLSAFPSSLLWTVLYCTVSCAESLHLPRPKVLERRSWAAREKVKVCICVGERERETERVRERDREQAPVVDR